MIALMFISFLYAIPILFFEFAALSLPFILTEFEFECTNLTVFLLVRLFFEIVLFALEIVNAIIRILGL